MSYKVITANIPKDLYDQLEEISNTEERSKSFFIKKGLEKILFEKQNKKKKEFLKTTNLIRKKALDKSLEKKTNKLLKELGFEK